MLRSSAKFGNFGITQDSSVASRRRRELAEPANRSAQRNTQEIQEKMNRFRRFTRKTSKGKDGKGAHLAATELEKARLT